MLAIPLYDDTPTTRLPVVTGGLIGACVLVFLWQQGLPPRAAEDAIYAYGMIPAVLFGSAELSAPLQRVPPWATLFTSMFLHGGWLHLIGNMVYLWLFGKGVENAVGSIRFLFFYFACGAAAATTQALVSPESAVPMVGASGAIAGTLGAYIVLYPRGNVVVFIWIFIFVRLVAIPAVILLGLWLALQLLSALAAPPGEPGVAFWAHIGGFISGAVLVLVIRRHGVAVLQPPRTGAFSITHPRDARLPRRRPRGPWG